MAQITTGIRRVLSHPAVYDAFQLFTGSKWGRARFARQVAARPGDRVLDIGCGTAELLDYLPEVEYWGFDVSESYIAAASKRYGPRGNFVCKLLDSKDLESLPKFDVVIASGVLHHLDTDTAHELFRLARSALRPGGRFVSIDCCYDNHQNTVSRLIVSLDRGQNILDGDGYKKLASTAFDDVVGRVYHQVWIPYTHWIMECRAP
ncbi:class I SAM-dependent methyltransferase [Cupriavidus pauculus]|uniref:Class I SAM-dependent methyltransferase n=1 Tax=Cupriavidus pauculus TaxID=82633 RepID=A0A2N5C427_9BURK|nr:class I SAM-dependent methyltransferase [Cupriavidus pauculus]PLP96983.1 class I SAM-dependent methyltransferase [Cupriavidus pauculus]